MRIHLTASAGLIAKKFDPLKIMGMHPHSLLSFAMQQVEPRYHEHVWSHLHHRSIILDSGAFSAWNSGKNIDLVDYGVWAESILRRYPDKEIYVINLDKIPGEAGRSATLSELRESVEISKRNADLLRSGGMPIVEVFHQDEPIELFWELLERAEGGLLCISPRNDVSTKKRGEWLRWIAGQWVKSRGSTIFPKCHGLAVTSLPLLESFPFFSADSSTWINPLRFGTSKGLKNRRIPTPISNEEIEIVKVSLRAEVRRFQSIEKRITKTWASRGIVWDN